MTGAMVSPDLEHFKKSLWPEFKRWCPWEAVIPQHQHRRGEHWVPDRAFVLTFRSELGRYVNLYCGGAKESEIGSWEGPNLSFIHFDEARRHKTPSALKVFMGRTRIPGPKGEPPQLYFTTTPRKHWLFDYFGGIVLDNLVDVEPNDEHLDFKRMAFVGTIPVYLNIDNLDPNYLSERALSLTSKEKRVIMDAEWEDEEDTQKFVNLAWWNACQETSRAWPRNQSTIIAVDAATGGATSTPDCFAVVAVTRHPDRPKDVMVRYCGIWHPPPGGELDFEGPLNEIRRLCREFAVIEVAYDKTQLHSDMARLRKEGIVHVREFPQTEARLVADRGLQRLIMERRIAHDGNPLLRQHIDNADFKKVREDGIRMVKRSESQKIDAAVALSMAADRCLYYNIW